MVFCVKTDCVQIYIFPGHCQNGHHPSSTRCHLQSLERGKRRGKIWGGEKREGKKSLEGKKSEWRRKIGMEAKKSEQRGKIPGGEKSQEGKKSGKIPGGEKSERKKLTFAPWRGKIPGGENSADSSIPQDITSSALDIGLCAR